MTPGGATAHGGWAAGSAALAVGALVVLPWSWSGPSAALRLWAGETWHLPVLALSCIALGAAWRGWAGIALGTALAAVAALLAGGFWLGVAGPPFGWGALLALGALAATVARALALRGRLGGDPMVVALVIGIAGLLALFIFLPVARSLMAAGFDAAGNLAPERLAARLLTTDIWGLGCVTGNVRCGVALNTVALGVLAGLFSTALGLAFALLIQRGGRRYGTLLRLVGILPIITPPFVIALALVVLFGRTGIVTGWLDTLLGLPPSRWIYGLPGVLIAQVLSFTPVAVLILHAGLRAIAPALEEAAQTLRASGWRVFRTVTWPLLRPAVANAFLLGFVESLADFANPLVLGGNFEVLSTKIFFAIAGAQHDPGRAAALALVLLAFTLGAFWLQNRWLGRRSYVTITGKGDGGAPAPLPRALHAACAVAVWPWVMLTVTAYALILAGGFVRDLGRGDLRLTLDHFHTGFAVEWGAHGLHWVGAAWDSFFTTIQVAAIAAPLTAAIGLLAAYVVARHDFPGRRAFEFLTMVSFAIPGTVIGVAYIVAFNVPPFELTGTAALLVLCFVFRNMPVGVRTGIAALAQIDRSLDEASATLRAGTVTTLRRILMPLLKPAIVATLVFSFTHAMTAVSAVIFLATAKYNLATVYIVGRVEAGEYPLAIAYSSVLIVFMLAIIVAIQWLVGDARLGRRDGLAAAGR
jgi:iron(III) transport system permease protein